MIKATDLRIGNYIHPMSMHPQGIILPHTAIIHRVGAIDKFGKIQVIEPDKEGNIEYNYGYYCEIPLSEDLLKKAGFKQLHGNTYRLEIKLPYEGERFIEAKLLNKGWIFYYVAYGIPASDNKRYVHELQNLYKEITGNELIIKL